MYLHVTVSAGSKNESIEQKSNIVLKKKQRNKIEPKKRNNILPTRESVNKKKRTKIKSKEKQPILNSDNKKLAQIEIQRQKDRRKVKKYLKNKTPHKNRAGNKGKFKERID